MKKFLLIVASCAVLIPAAVALGELAVDGKAKVGFKATGPGGLKINGKGSKVSVAEDAENVTFTVDMNEVSTGIKLRDSHMREKYVETAKYPNVEIVVPRASLKFPESGSAEDTVKATFKGHGQQMDVDLAYKIKRVKDTYQIEGEFDFNTETLGIEIPTYLGVTCHPDMKGFASFKLSGNPGEASPPTEEAKADTSTDTE